MRAGAGLRLRVLAATAVCILWPGPVASPLNGTDHSSGRDGARVLEQMADSDYIVLEDFEDGDIGQLPPGWQWRRDDDEKHKPYKVVQEDGNKYLAAEDNGESVILVKTIRWNIKQYPYISFRWRVHKIPEGGDERFHDKIDSAAGIYITYNRKLQVIPETVKWVWSSTLQVGATSRRSGGIGRPWNIVAASGTDSLGAWRTFVFNAYQAYIDTFGAEPPDRTLGIGVLSDANSTKSQAYADYDDIRALKTANAGSGVTHFVEAQ